AEKIYSELGRFKGLKADKPDLKIGVAGCVAQAEGQEIMRRQPMVDLVVGPQSYHNLVALEAQVAAGKKALDTEFPLEDKFEHLAGRPKAARGPTAFLTVQEGCDKFCAFCVVPYTRGAEASRPADSILHEARDLVDRGVREITLLGQNVNAYSGAFENGSRSLAQLIYDLSEIDGLKRIRYTTSHPNDMGGDLINAHAQCDKLMPYLHLPVQSGSDRILKSMNRKHSADSYLKLLDKVRAACPEILISGDFIVGFPGETDDDFVQTMALIRAVGYGQAYSFKYSPRPGTPAAERPQVEEAVKTARLAELQALLSEQQRTAQQRMVGKQVSVLFERKGRLEGQLVGKSEHLQAVHVTCPTAAIGEIHRVDIANSETNSLGGVLSQS
ncbi:MAG: tRNA (N6-isopentenyl adenosine(37)-C2)-methylthiotransferase MiaB, partial [Paracoccaceae bacterium]